MLEIDAELLRFSRAETDEYLVQRRGIPLDARDRMLLHRKTEGWIAGLWLASAALARHESRGDFIARFSGSNVAVAEYLAEDVLNLQPPAVRSFLMRTSILRELNPSLCQALVGAPLGAAGWTNADWEHFTRLASYVLISCEVRGGWRFCSDLNIDTPSRTGL